MMKKILIVYDKDIENSFEITIFKTKDFQELVRILSSEYGISLTKTHRKLDYIKVNFSLQSR